MSMSVCTIDGAGWIELLLAGRRKCKRDELGIGTTTRWWESCESRIATSIYQGGAQRKRRKPEGEWQLETSSCLHSRCGHDPVAFSSVLEVSTS